MHWEYRKLSESDILAKIRKAVIEGDRKTAEGLTREAIKENIPPLDTIMKACYPAMEKVGELYQDGEYFIPEMLMSTKAFETVMSIVEPLLKKEGSELGTIVIGTCKGDIHSLGKNLVASMLRASGLNVVDIGEDAPVEKFIEAAKESNADIVGISALMTTSLSSMKQVVDAIRKSDLDVKVIVGGGPVTDDFAKSIGADGYARDAVDAVHVVKNDLLSNV